MTTDSERPTVPAHAPPRMTIPQVREALSAFPVDQQPLLIAMLDAGWDDGFLVGAGKLPRMSPFAYHPGSDAPPAQQKKKRR